MKIPFLIILALCSNSFAEEKPIPSLWESNAESSVLMTSGNTSVTTLGLGVASAYRPDPWSWKGKANFLSSRSLGLKTAESYEAAIRGERKITDAFSGYGSALYLKNEFTGFQDRLGAEAGAIYQFLDSDGHTLSSEVGVGVLKENLVTGPGGTALGDRTFLNGRLGLEYKWKLSTSAELSDSLSLLENFSTTSDWRFSNTLSLTTIVTQVLSLKVSFRVDHLNVPVSGKKPTDTATNVALVAKF